MNNKLNFKVVDFTNAEEAIKVQRNIFEEEDGMINIVASLDRDLFVKITGINYPDDKVKYYLAYCNDIPVGITGFYIEDSTCERWLAWYGVLPEHRNLGYGKEILNWSFSKVLEEGAKVLRLYTDAIENKDAIELYKKMGFVGEKYSAEELPYDCYIYSKSLVDSKVELWNNKKLGLAEQYGFQVLSDLQKEKIYNEYKQKYFK